MKIVFEHKSPLPVKKYGGIERMLFWHMKELARQGHQPVLIGHPDSQVKQHGIELIVKTKENWWEQIPSDADAVQLFYKMELPIDIPVINTIGGSGQPGEVFSKNTVFVSQEHARLHGSECFIYNALDLTEYPFRPKKSLGWDHFLFLAKASWSVKNLKHASLACRKNKKELHICGGRSWRPSRYHRNHGMVGGQEKLQIMSQCDALLFPIRWPEPFGLAVIEAFALGLPAITSPYGSMKELITPETGLICHSKEDLICAVKEKPVNYCPETIRQYVEKRFSIEQFTSSYIELFEKLITGKEPLNKTAPTWQLETRPEQQLPF